MIGDTGPQIQDAMRRHRPLSREEEAVVTRQAKAGDKAARDRLVLCNLGIVIIHAKRYANGNIPFEDLIQYGVLGMLRAIDKFEPERGWRLSTYAFHWILAFLDEGVGMKEPIVRLAAGRARMHARKRAGERTPLVMSLDVPVNGDTDTTHLDLLESTEPSQSDSLQQDQHRSEIRERLDEMRLTMRERDVVESRFMRDQKETLDEIGARWGVCRERIRQIEQEMKERLREELADLAA